MKLSSSAYTRCSQWSNCAWFSAYPWCLFSSFGCNENAAQRFTLVLPRLRRDTNCLYCVLILTVITVSKGRLALSVAASPNTNIPLLPVSFLPPNYAMKCGSIFSQLYCIANPGFAACIWNSVIEIRLSELQRLNMRVDTWMWLFIRWTWPYETIFRFICEAWALCRGW